MVKSAIPFLCQLNAVCYITGVIERNKKMPENGNEKRGLKE